MSGNRCSRRPRHPRTALGDDAADPFTTHPLAAHTANSAGPQSRNPTLRMDTRSSKHTTTDQSAIIASRVIVS